jgi:hypothetical protein
MRHIGAPFQIVGSKNSDAGAGGNTSEGFLGSWFAMREAITIGTSSNSDCSRDMPTLG